MRVGFIGWRGMVGSVLMERMRAERDFEGIEATFFSTSNVGGQGPTIEGQDTRLQDAFDLEALRAHDVLITCQGTSYTNQVYSKLRAGGFQGYWIDAARTLRMERDAVLILDPVNRAVIDRGLAEGVKTFCGANCTVSLMLMALQGLYQAGLVEWLSSMTYQAASGAGAEQMRELIAQMAFLSDGVKQDLSDPAVSALQIDARVTAAMRGEGLPRQAFGVPLAASLIPWIDSAVEDGQTREEWKGMAETNKILGTTQPIAVDGICVRVGSMRCHAQGFTVKLTRDVPLDEINALIGVANGWVKVVPNTEAASKSQLTPAAISGTLQVPIGRIHKLKMGGEYLGAFSVGDQLLWGAAEPLRRMLRILREQ
jgi:aspartate-semialdehyde dehydrogenase